MRKRLANIRGRVESTVTTRTPKVEHTGEVVVIGLGRFGSSLARTLAEMGEQVIGIDTDPEIVAEHAPDLTQAIEADCTNHATLERLGIRNAVTAVVCIGTDIESSLLTTMALKDLGVKYIWAKAINDPHRRLLEGLGIHEVVAPESDMGQRVAHMVTGQTRDYLELDKDFVIAEMDAPDELIGVALGDSNLRARYRVTVVCVKPAGGQFTYADRETVLAPSDLIVIAGHRADVDRFTVRNR